MNQSFHKLSIIPAYTVLLLLAFLFSYKAISQSVSAPVKPQEIYDVINAVIQSQRLDTTRWKPNWPLRAINELWKIKVYFPKPKRSGKTITDQVPSGSINYKELLVTIFSPGDSAFFVYQNKYNDTFLLQPGKIKLIKLMSEKAFLKSQYTSKRYSEISFSIPIFSANHKKAWLGAMGTDEYYLLKIKRQWRVKMIKSRWQITGESEHNETKVLF